MSDAHKRPQHDHHDHSDPHDGSRRAGYAGRYRGIDFRRHPEAYRIGIGEQGVLIAEPYKSEILPHWKFRTPTIARDSAAKIYGMFRRYLNAGDFVGADMARKYLQMGFTRARRYANHAGGHKYAADGSGRTLPQLDDWQISEKAQSATVFYEYYRRAKDNADYLRLKQRHRQSYEA